MEDISIWNSSSNASVGKFEQVEGYKKLKREYEKFLKQAEKSDMANAITIREKQLEMLQALRKAALDESNYSNYDMIEDEIDFVTHALAYERKHAGKKVEEDFSARILPKKNDLASRFNACKNSKGEIDNETRRIVLAFKDVDVSSRTLARFVNICRGFEEVIPMDIVSCVEKLCDAKVASDVIFQAIDESPAIEGGQIGERDLSWADDLLTYKTMGIDDISALKCARTLNCNYKNKSDVFASVSKLLSSGFDIDMASQLVSMFTVGAKSAHPMLSTSGINSVITLKKNLSASRSAERNERQNPINKLNQVTYTHDDAVIIMKDNKVIEYIEKGNDTAQKIKREYEDIASEVENKIAFEFAKEFKTKDGKIDSSALRVFSALRASGVSYDYIVPLTKECLESVPEDKENGVAKHFDINVDKVNTLLTLKKAGALSSDVLTIFSAISKNEQGSYNQEDIDNACVLTGYVIGGKEVASLIPEVRFDKSVKEFVSDFSQVFDDKKGLLTLVSLAKNDSGVFDENAAEIMYNLAEHFFNLEDNPMPEHQFFSLAEKVVVSSKSPTSSRVDENCTNICIAMCRNKETPENILSAIDLCKDEYGYPSESLADIVWDMSKQQACFEDITKLINICKPINGILDIERASVISDLLDNGATISEVMNFANGLGQK